MCCLYSSTDFAHHDVKAHRSVLLSVILKLPQGLMSGLGGRKCENVMSESKLTLLLCSGSLKQTKIDGKPAANFVYTFTDIRYLCSHVHPLKWRACRGRYVPNEHSNHAQPTASPLAGVANNQWQRL